MLIETGRPAGAAKPARFGAGELGRARYESDGRFVEGRRAELDALRAMGARDPSLGRIYEGHFNGALLVALYGTPDQRERAHRDALAGHLFGVWNTQDGDGLELVRRGRALELRGSKTWASGAESVTRALVTAREPGTDHAQMCLVSLDETPAVVDASEWRPLGMQASDSFRVTFDGIALDARGVIGAPGDYERSPWFLGGALRFAAVHAGIVERLTSDVLAYLVARGRDGDPMQQARAGEMRIASRSALNWIDAGLEAWLAFDADGSAAAAARVVDVADMARLGIERAALDVIERAIRGLGAHGLLESLPFAARIRDLEMYLRQPAPDATLLRVGQTGFRASRTER